MTGRAAELRQSLSDLKADLLRDIRSRMREGRTDRSSEVVDQVEDSEVDYREGLELALLEMRAEKLTCIDGAIARLDAGQYGKCYECDGPIAVRRLRALPFAVRCHTCAEQDERGSKPSRPVAARRTDLAIDPGAARH